jgi:hypothetical protein
MSLGGGKGWSGTSPIPVKLTSTTWRPGLEDRLPVTSRYSLEAPGRWFHRDADSVPCAAQQRGSIGAQALPWVVGEHLVRVVDHLVALDVVPEVGERVEIAEPRRATPNPPRVCGRGPTLVTVDQAPCSLG